MGYIEKKQIDFEEAKKLAVEYPYMLVHMMSEIIFGDNASEKVKWDELLEARFFSDTEEMHIFKCEKKWTAVIVADDGNGKDELTMTYPVAGRFRTAGKELTVKQYLSEDEDGQLYVALTRLCGIA